MRRGRSPYPELKDRDWLYARYWGDGLSAERIAELIDFDCTNDAVLVALKRHGIKVRPAGGVPRRRGE